MTNISGGLYQVSIANIKKLKPFSKNICLFYVEIDICGRFYQINRSSFIKGHRLVRKILDPPDQQMIKIDLKGFYSCRKCICCRTLKVSNRGMTKITNIDQETFDIN